MNYYNPYFYNFPIGNQAIKTNFLSKLLGGKTLSFTNILNGTQQVLNIANQTIPLVKQAKPVFGNMKTMFKIMNEFKKNDGNKNKNYNANNNEKNTIINSNINNTIGPTFFE